MKFPFKQLCSFSGTVILLATILSSCSGDENSLLSKPNILWITFEDISPLLGCYGDPNAITPNLDRLASEGLLYRNAFANAPVCAPARNTIITGMYPPGMGTQHMRSKNRVPEFVRLYPGYLRDAGYYCTNNSKTDYNLSGKEAEWNESSNQAHYKNRKPGQPFFAIFNIGICHESCLHNTLKELQHDPADVRLPPYHPDLPEIRHDWAQHYHKITQADSIAGEILKELEDAGLEDSTVVLIYGDHGGVVARSKRFMYVTGLRVPMIARFPEMYQHLAPGNPGTETDTPVSFIDLAPTLVNLAGLDIPEYMQGHPFLGKNIPERSQYVHTFRGRMDERYDFSRGTFSDEFHYIINYMPQRIYAQHLNYLWRAPSMRAWEKAFLAGECTAEQSGFFQSKPAEELYDRRSDPWEVSNLAEDPAFGEILAELRGATINWQLSIRDAGFIPEGLMKKYGEGSTIYDYVQSEAYPLEEIMDIAFKAIQGDAGNIETFRSGLQHENPVIRYWSAMASVILGREAMPLLDVLVKALRDEVPEVRIQAAEALYKLGETGPALSALRESLEDDSAEAILMTVNIIQVLGKDAINALSADLVKLIGTSKNKYVLRATEHALKTIQL